MVDYGELRKKYPTKNLKKRTSAAAIKAIAREYELKKAELSGMRAPNVKRGIVFYSVLLIGLLLVGSLVLSAAGKGGRERNDRAQLNARKSVDALAVALGRYRYHTGEYPTTAEGLEQLASTQVTRAGWNGPYIRKVVKDPWGHDYVYVRNGATENPTVYSRGPDGLAGTTDDVIASAALYDEPFRDTSWTEGWMPYRLRGYIVAPDERTKKAVEEQVEAVKRASAAAAAAKLEPVPRRAPPREEYAEDGTFVFGPDPWGERPSSVRIATHWNREGHEGEPVDVVCSTEGNAVELYLNGVSQGRREGEPGTALVWSVPYEEGELKAIAFRDGHPIGEDAVRTTGPVFSLRLTADVDGVGDGEVAYLRVDAVDGNGLAVPTADYAVALSVDGPGTLESVSGGPLGEPLALVRGRAVAAVVRAMGGTGLPVKVSASAPGVRGAALVIPRR